MNWFHKIADLRTRLEVLHQGVAEQIVLYLYVILLQSNTWEKDRGGVAGW